MSFGKVVRTLRTTKGLSLREMARDLDLSPTYLSLIENGKIPPPVEEKVHKLEGRLGVPEGYLMRFTDRNPEQIKKILAGNSPAASFLELAVEKEFTADEFSLISGLLSTLGKEKFLQILHNEWRRIQSKVDLSDHQYHLGLKEELVFPNVEAIDGISLIKNVSELIHSVKPEISGERISKALIKREKNGSTAVGEGLAIPHATIDGLEDKVIAFARSPKGVRFSPQNDSPVFYSVFILSTETLRESHVKDLARVARLFLQPDFKRKIIEAKNRSEIVKHFAEEELKNAIGNN